MPTNNKPRSRERLPNRRNFLRLSLMSGPALAASAPLAELIAPSCSSVANGEGDGFELSETTLSELQQAMQSGKHTARSLAERYLERIDALDRQGPALRSVIERNPDALSIADMLDAERKRREK